MIAKAANPNIFQTIVEPQNLSPTTPLLYWHTCVNSSYWILDTIDAAATLANGSFTEHLLGIIDTLTGTELS